MTLTDERFVDPRNEESNERLLRARLITGQAAAARLIPLKGAGPTPQADAAAAEPNIRAVLPFAAMLLGMGGDGHIGSLFPGDPDLAAWLDPGSERLCVGVAHSPDPPPVPRISLTLAAMLRCGRIVVLVSGKEKRTLIERVLSRPRLRPPDRRHPAADRSSGARPVGALRFSPAVPTCRRRREGWRR